jgi:hypothetical protein
VTRSPLYIHLEECLEGRAVIRSHGPACMQSEEHTCLERLDENQVRPQWGLGKVVGGRVAGTGVCVCGGGAFHTLLSVPPCPCRGPALWEAQLASGSHFACRYGHARNSQITSFCE